MKITRLHKLLFVALLLAALRAAPAGAASYDFNPDSPFGGTLPTDIGAGSSPVYITNTNAAEAAATASVDSLRVGQRGSLNIGFDADRTASAPVALGVAGDMTVEGGVRVGHAGESAAWLPDTHTGYAVGLNVGGALTVERGGQLLVEGNPAVATEPDDHSGVAAGRVDVNGGAVLINRSGELHARQGMTVRNGGSVVVNAGLPEPRDTDEMTGGADWAFQGLGLGGTGLDLEHAGLLQAGENGATVDGAAAGTAIRVQRGGYLDVSQNDMLARGVGEIAVDGTYRSGVGAQLTSENGGITFGADAKTVLSTDLHRQINTNGVGAADSIARARNIDFNTANGGVPAIRSGMGFYDLAVVPFADETTGRSGEVLRVVGASRTVSGDGSAADRAQFHDNLGTIWDSPVQASQAEVMYDLLANRYPAIVASGESGEFNRDALESLMNGEGTGIPARGVADDGVAELYNGGGQWGPNSVAFNTAELFMAGLDRRAQRIGAELDRLGYEEVVASGETVTSTTANPSLLLAGLPPQGSPGGDGRIWKGALYACDSAEFDSGVAGYQYDPKGLLLGYDKTLGRWSLGGAVAFARGDYEDKAATANESGIDSYSAGLFAAYHGDSGFNASAFATMSALDNSLADTRGGMRREADFSSRAWSAGARLGYDMLLADRLVLQPSVGLTHVSARADSHDESLDGVEVMRVGDIGRDGTLIPLDLTLGYDLLRNFDSLLRLNAGLGYAYGIGADAPSGTLSYTGLAGAPDVDILRREPGKHRLNAGIGLLYTRERFDFSLRYDYTRRDAQTAHQANTRLGIKF